jgi:tripartite-type tricarboxylate transporter receptor subunit TctC
MLVTGPGVLVVHPSLPARNVKELIAIAKSRPGQLLYASPGNGTPPHLAAELFKSMAGIDIVHVPYKGNAQAMTDLIAGQESLSFPTGPSAMPHVHTKRLRALGVTSAKRATGLPDIPTIAEGGLPGYDASAWYGVLAPAGTPSPIVAKLQSEIHVAMRAPDIVDKLSAQGLEPAPNNADEFARFIAAELAKWSKIIGAAGIKVE